MEAVPPERDPEAVLEEDPVGRVVVVAWAVRRLRDPVATVFVRSAVFGRHTCGDSRAISGSVPSVVP